MKLIPWRYTVISHMTTIALMYYRLQKFAKTLLRYAGWSKASYRCSDFMRYFHTIVKCRGVDYILITNLLHWLLFVHKILFSSTCCEPQVLIFRRIQLYTCSLWYCHSLLSLSTRMRVSGGLLVHSLSENWLSVSSHSSCVPTGHRELS